MDNKLILWDIDGTLMYCGSNGTQALNETFYQLYGIDNAFSGGGIGGAMDSIILDNIMEKHSISKNDKEEIMSLYIQLLENILSQNEEKKILPGIKELLEYIKNDPYIYGCILTSNFKVGAEVKLKSLGLSDYFSTGGYGDIYGEKWHAAISAIKETEQFYRINFKKDNIYIIGDTWYDIECARKLGIKSIAVATGWVDYDRLKDHGSDYLFEDLSQYQDMIRIIENRK